MCVLVCRHCVVHVRARLSSIDFPRAVRERCRSRSYQTPPLFGLYSRRCSALETKRHGKLRRQPQQKARGGVSPATEADIYLRIEAMGIEAMVSPPCPQRPRHPLAGRARRKIIVRGLTVIRLQRTTIWNSTTGKNGLIISLLRFSLLHEFTVGRVHHLRLL